MRLLIFTISKGFLATFFALLVQAASAQVEEDIFGENNIGQLEQHIDKKEMLQETQQALVQLKLKAIKANDNITLARSLYDLMLIRDERTEDTLYFKNSAFMDTILNDNGAPAQLKAIMYVLHARRLSNFNGRYLKFNQAAYRVKSIPADYAAFNYALRDSIANKDLQSALTIYDFGDDASGLLWLSSNPGVFLFTPSLRDIIFSDGIYLAANRQYSYPDANKMKNWWASLPSAAFGQLLDSISASPLAARSVLAKYRQWMLFHKTEPGIQLFIGSLARKYIFLSGGQDTTSRKSYINYLLENTSSPNPEFAAHIIYQLCLLWNEDGSKYVNFDSTYGFLIQSNFVKAYQFMPKKALDLYSQNEKLIAKFPVLSKVLDVMKQQVLKSGVRIKMDNSFAPGGAVPFEAIYKNAGALFYKLVPLSTHDAITDQRAIIISDLLLRKTSAEGKFVLPLPDDHNYHAVYLKLEAPAIGNYALLFSEKEITKDNRNLHSIAFHVTGIAAINTDERVYVLNRKTGFALPGADVEMFKNISPANGRHVRVNEAGYIIAPEEKADSLIITYRGDTLGYKPNVKTNEPTENIYDKDEYDNLADFYDDKLKMSIFTDRAIYRPGQTVQYKIVFLTSDPLTGAPILFNSQNINGLFFKNRLGKWLKENKAELVVKDPFNRVADSIKVKINDFGSFAGSLVLPKNAATGNWRIEGGPETDNSNNGDFQVEEYKRPTIELSMEKQQKMLKPGRPFVIKLKLRSFTGADLGNIPITYTLNRNGRLPARSRAISVGDYTNVKLADTTGYTDSNGVLSIPVNDTAVAHYTGTDEDILYYTYRISAKAVDATGESTDISESVDVSSRPVRITINAARIYDRQALQPLNVQTTANFEGEVARKVAVKLYRVMDPETSGSESREVDQWYYNQQQWDTWFPNLAEFATDLKPEHTLILDTVINTGLYQKLVLPKDKLTAGFYHLDADCRDSGRISGLAKYDFKVFDTASGEVPGDGINYMAANSAKPGETVTWYTSAQNESYAIYQALYEAGTKRSTIKTIYKEIKEGKGLCRWAFTIPADAVGNILLTRVSVFNNDLSQEKTTVYLVRPQNDPPEIIIEKYRKVMAPGAQEVFSLSIKTKNENVAAELMTTLYDASLDKLEKLQWEPPRNMYDRTYLSTNWNYLSHSLTAGDYSPTERLYLQPDGSIAGNGVAEGLEGKVSGLAITDASGLNEVVVVGYGSVKKDLTGSVSTVTLRGSRSLAEYKQPLIILDGVPYNGDLSKIAIGSITQGMVLKGADASAIYGSEASQGVLILSTKGPIMLPNVVEEPVIKVRKNFNETAFFFPQVHADSAGYYHFSFTMPETATEWNWKIMAHTRDARFAYVERKLQTRMNLMVQPNMPRFLYQGDKIKLESRISNLDTTAISGNITCKIEDAVTGQDITSMLVANAKQTFNLVKKSSGAAAFWLNIPARQTNPLKVIITVAGPGASDGEEHILPVLSTRIFTRQSVAVHFTEAPSLTVVPAKLPTDAELYGIGMSIQQKPQAALINALPWLANYSYDCAEQTFNKLRAKVAAIRLMKTDTIAQRQYKIAMPASDNAPVKDEILPDELAEAIMPWLNIGNQTKTAQKQLLHLLDTISTGLEIDKYLERLYKLQQADGGLSWFDGGRSNDYISAYVLAGFGQLKRLGWKPGSNMVTRYDAFLRGLVKYDQQQVILSTAIKSYDVFDLYALSYWRDAADEPAGFNTKIDSLLALGWKNTDNNDLGQQALVIINTLRYTNPGSALYKKALTELTNIQQLAIEDSENGLRWKEIADSEELGGSAEETIALLAEAFETAGNYNGINSGIIKWLLTTKQDQHWQTTKATAAAIDMLQKEKGSAIGEDKAFSADINGRPITVSDGLFSGAPAAFTTATQVPASINLTQQGKNASGEVSCYYFTRTDRLDTLNKAIKMHKQFYKYSKDGSMVELKAGDTLKVGDNVHVKLTIETASRLKFVHVSDPRAATFEPKDNQSGYHYGDGIDYYESVKDTGLELFAESVPRGITNISYDLVVAMAGNFSSGPAHLQCMYHPSAAAYSNSGGFISK